MSESPQVTIASLIREQAIAHPDKPMVIDPTERVSYRELDESTRMLAATFVEAGIGPGTRVGLIMPNNARWVQIALAVTRIGAVIVPFSTLLTGRELAAQLKVSGVAHLISVEEFRGHRYLDELSAALGTPTLLPGGVTNPEVPALRRIWSPATVFRAQRFPETRTVVDALAKTVTPDATMAIIFTSGSSGAPKGVVHSHRSALGAVAAGLPDRLIDSQTRLYLPMPFFWVGGFGSGIVSALLAGATLVTEEVPEAESTLRLLERERVTHFRGWPDQAVALAHTAAKIDADLSSLQVGSLEALLPLAERSQPGARANLFGMTESFGPYCGYPADTDMPRSAWGSCGKPFHSMEVRIADPESALPLPDGATGEILLRGPHVLRGICQRGREEVFTADGFYPTGDLGHLDDGFLFYHGRSDDMVKISGATVYPSEVAAALKSIEGIDNAFVTHIDGASGPQVGAVVVSRSGFTTGQLRSAARQVLSSFKVPTVWLVLDSDDEIPRGGTGKVKAGDLRKLLCCKGSQSRVAIPAAAGTEKSEVS
ncbi:class I adenylate-forming enzyme family protein [Gordonia sp. LSe1-13]|uniref:Class I adenylate-forming enzyme family protein n=1 Tax=Gordonia sesuvii TaxID=3116777 RepID=A0ABU7MAA9_9ACTN|nr:class I adenylate-forming enzyme family protein [Gordonia sp. LSe1-13]